MSNKSVQTMTEQKTSIFARITRSQKAAFYAKVRQQTPATPSAVLRRLVEMYLDGQIKI
jgi:hypothetical protein